MVMNLLKSFKVMISAVLIAAVLSGCMNSVNLNDLKDIVVVEGTAIDIKDDKLNLIVQTLNTGSSSGSEMPQGNMTVNTEDSGETIVDAIAAMSKNLSKNLFFGQNKIIIFGKEATQSDFDKKLDYFLRSSNSRPDVTVCMSETTAKDIIESKENDAHIPSENIVYLLQNGQDAGVSAYVSTNNVLNLYADKTSDIYLPVVKKEEDRDSVQTAGIGLFDNERLVHITDDEETMGFLFISGKIKNCSIEFENGELGLVSVEISSPKTKNHVEIIDGKIIFVSDMDTQLVINEIENGIATALSEEKLEEICKNADKEIERLCTKAFFACRENSSDSLRVGEYLAKDSPGSYRKLADEWDMYFKTVSYSVDVETHLKELSDNTQLD